MFLFLAFQHAPKLCFLPKWTYSKFEEAQLEFYSEALFSSGGGKDREYGRISLQLLLLPFFLLLFFLLLFFLP